MTGDASAEENKLSEERESMDGMQPTAPALPESERERLDARAAQMRLQQRDGQGDPARVSLEAFRQHPRVQHALETMTDEQARAEMEAIDRQATLDVDRGRRQERWEAYVATRRYDYAAASIPGLEPGQNPEGKVSGWWPSGHRTLFLAGEADAGKTYAAHAILNTVATLDRDAPLGTPPITVRAYRIVDLAEALLPKDGREAGQQRAALIHDLTTIDLILLDDLGREKVNDWWLGQLFRILDSRASDERKRQIVTANFSDRRTIWSKMDLNLEAGGKGYGSPISSRIKQNCLGAWLEGSKHRRVVGDWQDPFEAGL